MNNLYILKNQIPDIIVAIYSDYEIAEEDRSFLTTTNENTYNIILYSTTDVNPNRYLEKGNDTQNFIMNYLYPLYKNWTTFYKNENILSGISSITNSKFAFLDKYGKIKLVGEFEKDEDGVLYSNDNYKKNWYYDYKYMYYDDYYYQYPPVTYCDSKKTKEKEDYSYDLMLEPDWYYSIKGGEFQKVGDRELVYDYYTCALYEILDNGTYSELGEDVIIYDENGEEIIF